MALLHRMSEECVKSELGLFTVPLTQTSIDKCTYVEMPPLSAITDSGPIDFFVSASSEDYMDLNNTYLHLRVKITNPDGSDLALQAESYGAAVFILQPSLYIRFNRRFQQEVLRMLQTSAMLPAPCTSTQVHGQTRSDPLYSRSCPKPSRAMKVFILVCIVLRSVAPLETDTTGCREPREESMQCESISTEDGYRFTLATVCGELLVYLDNQILQVVLFNATLPKQRCCWNLTVICYNPSDGGMLDEFCVKFVTDSDAPCLSDPGKAGTTPTAPKTPQARGSGGFGVAVGVGVPVVVVAVAGVAVYCLRKKKRTLPQNQSLELAELNGPKDEDQPASGNEWVQPGDMLA